MLCIEVEDRCQDITQVLVVWINMQPQCPREHTLVLMPYEIEDRDERSEEGNCLHELEDRDQP